MRLVPLLLLILVCFALASVSEDAPAAVVAEDTSKQGEINLSQDPTTSPPSPAPSSGVSEPSPPPSATPPPDDKQTLTQEKKQQQQQRPSRNLRQPPPGYNVEFDALMEAEMMRELQDLEEELAKGDNPLDLSTEREALAKLAREGAPVPFSQWSQFQFRATHSPSPTAAASSSAASSSSASSSVSSATPTPEQITTTPPQPTTTTTTNTQDSTQQHARPPRSPLVIFDADLDLDDDDDDDDSSPLLFGNGPAATTPPAPTSEDGHGKPGWEEEVARQAEERLMNMEFYNEQGGRVLDMVAAAQQAAAALEQRAEAEFANETAQMARMFDGDATESQVQEREAAMTRTLTKLAQQGSYRANMGVAARHRYGIGTKEDCHMAFAHYQTVADALTRELDGVHDGRDLPLDLEMMRLSSAQLDGVLGEEEEGLADLLEYDKIAAEGGDVWAQKELGWRSLLGRGLEQDHGVALNQFEQAAAIGDPEAMHNLGYMHLQGLGVPKNLTKAAAYFEKAAAANITQAFNALGFLHFRGEEVGRNLTQAQHWFELAAMDGDADANYNLGLLIEEIHGNATLIAHHFSLAARMGHWRGMLAWAEVQYKGAGTPANCAGGVRTLASLVERYGQPADDLRQAIKNYKSEKYDEALWQMQQLAEQGLEVASSNVAFMLAHNLGNFTSSGTSSAADVLTRQRAQVRYVRLASIMGSAHATYQLAEAYWYGRGALEDRTLAVSLYERAASNRSSEAALALGYMYHLGIGVEQNLTRAEELYRGAQHSRILTGHVAKLPSIVALCALQLHISATAALALVGVELGSDVYSLVLLFGAGVVLSVVIMVLATLVLPG